MTFFSLLVAGGVLFGVVQVWREARADAMAGLEQFIVPPVTLGGLTYTFDNGRMVDRAGKPAGPIAEIRAARLARYAVLARVDPIFALNGVDTVKLAVAVNALRKDTNALAEADAARSAVPWRELHPLRFLETLPLLEEHRRELIARPSIGAARAYQLELERSVGLAIEEAALLREHFHTVGINGSGTDAAANDDRPIAFLRTITDREAFIHSLTEVGISFRRRAAAAKARGGCLSVWHPCRGPLGNGWDGLVNVKGTTGDAVGTSAVNQTVLDLLRMRWAEEQLSMDQRVFWVRTRCFGGGQVNRPFSFLSLPPTWPAHIAPEWIELDLGSLEMPNLLDDLHFVDIDHLAPFGRELYRPFLERGFPFFWQASTNFYTCPDATYWAELTSLARSVAELSASPLFRIEDANADQELAGRLAEISNRLTSLAAGAEVRETQFRSVAAELGALLLDHGETSLARIIGVAGALTAQEFMQQLTQRSAAFNNLVAEGVHQHYRLRRLWLDGSTELGSTPFYYLITHANPSLYFLTFNYSFFGRDAAPSFIAEGRSYPADSVFVNFAAARGRSSLPDLLRIMAFSAHQFDLPARYESPERE